jgi:hypothetical protein
VAGYRFDTLGLVEPEPRAGLHELVEALRIPAASRAGLAVAGEPAEAGDTALAMTDRAMSALDDDALLIDWEPCELAGEAAVRTLVLEQLGGLATVVLEQWRLVAAGEAWTVTATADLAAWARLAGRFRDAVATLEVEP